MSDTQTTSAADTIFRSLTRAVEAARDHAVAAWVLFFGATADGTGYDDDPAIREGMEHAIAIEGYYNGLCAALETAFDVTDSLRFRSDARKRAGELLGTSIDVQTEAQAVVEDFR